MDRSSNTYGSVRKETRRRSRHTSGTSDFPRHVLSRPNEQEKPLKHQISFLLNQTHTGSSSLDQRHSDVQSRRHDPGSMSRSMHRPVKIEPAPEDMWRDAMRQSKNHRYGQSSYARRSSSEKRRTCEQCGKVFAQPADLKKHIKCVHLKERPFQCDECEAAFGEKGNLNRHKKSVHNKERPWVCHQCQLPFAFRDTLTRHIRAVHEDIRPFSCDMCESAFKKRDHLHRHREALHGIPKR